MGIWQQIKEYLYLSKKDPTQTRTKWTKYMHGINRISLFMFLIALVVFIVRRFIWPLLA